MAERPEQVDPALSTAGRHALHDEELIASYAVDGDAAEDSARARALIERCTTCRDLHADLVAIGSTIRAAGTAEAVGATRPAPLDFRLTASDAVRLRGGSTLQRWAARFVDGLASFGRPVGASLATVGVVGLIVGSMALGQLGFAPAAGGAAPGETSELAGSFASGAPTTVRTDGFGPMESARDAGTSKAFSGRDVRLGSGATFPLVLLGVSILVLVVGIGFGIAGTRRRRNAPARRTTRT